MYLREGEHFNVAILNMPISEMDGLILAEKICETKPVEPFVDDHAVTRRTRRIGQSHGVSCSLLNKPINE